MKKFPVSNFPQNPDLHKSHKKLEQHLTENLNNLIQLYNNYAKKVFE